jgi:hypothetical protein
MTYTPQPGAQYKAFSSPCRYIFFGGARGGSKTFTLWMRHVYGAEEYGRDWNGLIVRKKFEEFNELRRVIDAWISNGLPAERIGGNNQVNEIRFANGARVRLDVARKVDDADDWQGHQYTEVSIDEGAQMSFVAGLIEKLKGCLRSPAGVPCAVFITGNPGGAGHGAIKQLFIDRAPAGEPFADTLGHWWVFIPSKLEDNAIFCAADPEYRKQLESIQDPALRRAWLDGDWAVNVGQAFEFVREYHVVEPIPIPPRAQLYSTFDWGYGAPFSWGWWFVGEEGRLYRFAEWYGADAMGNGLHLTDSQIADGVVERERELQLDPRDIVRLAGHDCFAAKPDYVRGGQAPSTAEVFAEKGIMMNCVHPDRKMKLRQFREYMRIPRDKTGLVINMPMVRVFPCCESFIRTVPSLCYDDNNREDIDSSQEDHVFDESCLVVQARPRASAAPVIRHAESAVNSVARSWDL